VTLTSCVSLGSVPVFFSFFHVLYYPHHNRKAQRLYSFLVGFLAISIEIWLHLDRLISIEDVPVPATVVLRGGAKAKSFWSMKMCVFPIFFSFDWTAAAAIGTVSFLIRSYTDKGAEFIGLQGSKRRLNRTCL
jgi:hypothetical protein